MQVENIDHTKWHRDDPVDYGHYLCAVAGHSKPMLLFWWAKHKYWTRDNGEEIPCVMYYMKLDDIPMPEGW